MKYLIVFEACAHCGEHKYSETSICDVHNDKSAALTRAKALNTHYKDEICCMSKFKVFEIFDKQFSVSPGTCKEIEND